MISVVMVKRNKSLQIVANFAVTDCMYRTFLKFIFTADEAILYIKNFRNDRLWYQI